MRDFHRRGFGKHRMGKHLVMGIALFLLLGLLVMSLWNALLPVIIGVKSIGFWQALGLLVLCRILFGGLGFRPGMFGMRRRMHERWMQMTPEQRDVFMQQHREGFGRRDHGEHCRWHKREQNMAETRQRSAEGDAERPTLDQ